jgi:hypothetical protein
MAPWTWMEIIYVLQNIYVQNDLFHLIDLLTHNIEC